MYCNVITFNYIIALGFIDDIKEQVQHTGIYVRILNYYRINTSTHTGGNMVTFHSSGPS